MTGLVRVKGWEQRLSTVKIRGSRLPWAWGRFDCCIFAADCVLAVTTDTSNCSSTSRGIVDDNTSSISMFG